MLVKTWGPHGDRGSSSSQSRKRRRSDGSGDKKSPQRRSVLRKYNQYIVSSLEAQKQLGIYDYNQEKNGRLVPHTNLMVSAFSAKLFVENEK